MKVTAKIELPKKLTAKIKELKMPLSGGYEQGFEDGKEAGYVDGVKYGEAIGYEKGHAAGFEDGAAEIDRFWDIYQQNGERTNYEYAFAGKGWTNDTFKPKHKKITVEAAQYMFAFSNITGDLRDYLDIEWGNGTKSHTFNGSKFEKIGVVSTEGSQPTQMFYNASNLSFIERFIVFSDSTGFSSTFYGCTKLEEIRIEGVIGQSISFSNSPLSVASMKNIIEHLKNFSGTGQAYSKKLTFTSTCWDALEADGVAPDGGTWKNYVYNLGWNT